MNLQEMLGKLKELDEGLETEVNWQELIGDIQNKVDNIKYIIDKLDVQDIWLSKQRDDIDKRLKSVRTNKKNLLNWINFSLTSTQTDKVPGLDWVVKIQNNPKTLEITEEASRDLWKDFDKYIRRNVTYSWDKEAIKTDLKEEKIPETLIKKINWKQGTHVRFYPRKDT